MDSQFQIEGTSNSVLTPVDKINSGKEWVRTIEIEDIHDLDEVVQQLATLTIAERHVVFYGEYDNDQLLSQLVQLGNVNSICFNVTDPAAIFAELRREELVKLLSQVVRFEPNCVWYNLPELLQWFDKEGYSFDNVEHLRINNLQMLHPDTFALLWEAFPHMLSIQYHDYTAGLDEDVARCITVSDCDDLAEMGDNYGIALDTYRNVEYMYSGDYCRSKLDDKNCLHGRKEHICKMCNKSIQLSKRN